MKIKKKISANLVYFAVTYILKKNFGQFSLIFNNTEFGIFVI